MIEQYEYNGHTIEIHHDENPANPRTEYDNAGHLILWHNQFVIGDKHEYTPEEFLEFKESNPDNIYIPIYLYNHSGIAISATPFHCKWDSGQVGWAYIDAETIKTEFNGDTNKATSALNVEIQEYDEYIAGNYYGYKILENDNLIESCWGFNGLDYCKEQAQEVVNLVKTA